MRKLLSKKAVITTLVVGSAVIGSTCFAATDTAVVDAAAAAFTDLEDTAVALSAKLVPIGIAIVVAIFSVILAVSSSKKVGNVATR